jgi:hypothetical protein
MHRYTRNQGPPVSRIAPSAPGGDPRHLPYSHLCHGPVHRIVPCCVAFQRGLPLRDGENTDESRPRASHDRGDGLQRVSSSSRHGLASRGHPLADGRRGARSGQAAGSATHGEAPAQAGASCRWRELWGQNQRLAHSRSQGASAATRSRNVSSGLAGGSSGLRRWRV